MTLARHGGLPRGVLVGSSRRANRTARCTWKVSHMTNAFTRVSVRVPLSVTSCEHCRAVTWAGETACRCEFASFSIDRLEIADDRLDESRPASPGESGRIAPSS
jgi:hypothetical protein